MVNVFIRWRNRDSGFYPFSTIPSLIRIAPPCRACTSQYGTGAPRSSGIRHHLASILADVSSMIVTRPSVRMADKEYHVLTPALITALIAAEALAAPPSEAPPREFAYYGPLELCSRWFNLKVDSDEAVHVAGDIARIISDDMILAVKFADDRNWFDSEDGYEKYKAGSDIRWRRQSQPVPDRSGTLRFAPQGLGNGDVRYVFSGGPDGREIFVGSTRFDGTARDKRLLRRVRPADTHSRDCVSLWHSMTDVSDTEPVRGIASNQKGYANVRNEGWQKGPFFYCIDGAGFEVRAGEQINRPWHALGIRTPVDLQIADNAVGIEQYRDTQQARPKMGGTGSLQEIMRGSRLTFTPFNSPRSATLTREVPLKGFWKLELGIIEEQAWLSVIFRADSAPLALKFLERLEFSDIGDPRCARDAHAPGASAGAPQ